MGRLVPGCRLRPTALVGRSGQRSSPGRASGSSLFIGASRVPVRQPWQSTVASLASLVFGRALLLTPFVAGLYLVAHIGGPGQSAFEELVFGSFLSVVLTALACGALYWAARFFVRLGLALRPRGARRAMEADARAPIVFLRPFDEDGQARTRHDLRDDDSFGRVGTVMMRHVIPYAAEIRLLVKFYFGLDDPTLEEELESYFSWYGPFVAIGRPGEQLSTAGAARMYVSDDDWQAEVLALVDRAGFVVWQAGPSAGTMWELERLVERLEPSRLMLIIPDPMTRPAAFEGVKGKIDDALPRPLPEFVTRTNFVLFDDDWSPRGHPFIERLGLDLALSASPLDLPESFQMITPMLRREAASALPRLSLFGVLNFSTALAMPVLMVMLALGFDDWVERCEVVQAGARDWRLLQAAGRIEPRALAALRTSVKQASDTPGRALCVAAWGLPESAEAGAAASAVALENLDAWADEVVLGVRTPDEVRTALESIRSVPALDRWASMQERIRSLMAGGTVFLRIDGLRDASRANPGMDFVILGMLPALEERFRLGLQAMLGIERLLPIGNLPDVGAPLPDEQLLVARIAVSWAEAGDEATGGPVRYPESIGVELESSCLAGRRVGIALAGEAPMLESGSGGAPGFLDPNATRGVEMLLDLLATAPERLGAEGAQWEASCAAPSR